MDKSELLKELRIDRDAPAEGSSRLRTWLALAAALVVLAGLLAWFFGREQPVEVTVAVADAMPAVSAGTSVLDATGYVTARRQATVSAKITGKVRDVRIEEGQHVRADDVLATLDDAEARVDAELRRAQVAVARAQLAEAEVASANADREFQRQQDLAESRLTSVAALDAARTQSEALRARVSSQASSLQVAREALQAALVQLDNTIVRAPFDGVVTVKAAQPGEMISPISAGGGSIRTGIGTIVDMGSLEIQVDVSESYINRVQPGQKVEAVLNAYPDWRVPASVIAIVPTADRSKATVKVRIALAEKDARIVPEMGVRVAFLESAPAAAGTPAPPRGALIPAAAIRQDAGRDVVFVLRDGRAERRMVSLGGTLGDRRQVQAGVSPGDEVIVDPPAGLRDGNAARARESGDE
ncbi:MAG: efflux RND transporter periplasmic adaptor subunit [Gammaproteobacteria bacterium]|nr:efflux RND transporter periplasmic adaptor subunit [Gammaproteobacteria bacterium]